MKRRDAFNLACQTAGITIEEFAEQQDVSERFIHLLLTGERKSARVNGAITKLIRRQMRSIKKHLDEMLVAA